VLVACLTTYGAHVHALWRVHWVLCALVNDALIRCSYVSWLCDRLSMYWSWVIFVAGAQVDNRSVSGRRGGRGLCPISLQATVMTVILPSHDC